MRCKRVPAHKYVDIFVCMIANILLTGINTVPILRVSQTRNEFTIKLIVWTAYATKRQHKQNIETYTDTNENKHTQTCTRKYTHTFRLKKKKLSVSYYLNAFEKRSATKQNGRAQLDECNGQNAIASRVFIYARFH